MPRDPIDTTNMARWFGSKPVLCQCCHDPLENEEFFYDSNHHSPIANRLIWGIVCSACFEVYGLGLGVGLGQKYENKPPYFRVENPTVIRVIAKYENGTEKDITQLLNSFGKGDK